MSKTKTSFALITVFLLLAQLSMAGAEDLLDKTVLASSSLSFRPADIPVEKWRWTDAGPGLNLPAVGTADPVPGRITADSHFLTFLLPDGIGVNSSPRDSLFMDRSTEEMLRGEPEDTACVLGIRYTFSDFDLSHFCKSLFNLIARGNRPPAREESGSSTALGSSGLFPPTLDVFDRNSYILRNRALKCYGPGRYLVHRSIPCHRLLYTEV